LVEHPDLAQGLNLIQQVGDLTQIGEVYIETFLLEGQYQNIFMMRLDDLINLMQKRLHDDKRK